MTQRLTYTVRETAEILGISTTSAYECVQRGDIPSLTFGRRIVITRRDLEQLLGPLPDGSDQRATASPVRTTPSATTAADPPNPSSRSGGGSTGH